MFVSEGQRGAWGGRGPSSLVPAVHQAGHEGAAAERVGKTAHHLSHAVIVSLEWIPIGRQKAIQLGLGHIIIKKKIMPIRSEDMHRLSQE